MREFVTAAKEKLDAEHGETPGRVEFKIDGEVYYADMPSSGQMAVVIAMISRHMPELERIAGVIEFFNSVLEENSRGKLIGRLMDPRDDFEAQDVMNILMHLLEEWGARPTVSPSDSAKSSSGGGRKSKQRTPA